MDRNRRTTPGTSQNYAKAAANGWSGPREQPQNHGREPHRRIGGRESQVWAHFVREWTFISRAHHGSPTSILTRGRALEGSDVIPVAARLPLSDAIRALDQGCPYGQTASGLLHAAVDALGNDAPSRLVAIRDDYDQLAARVARSIVFARECAERRLIDDPRYADWWDAMREVADAMYDGGASSCHSVRQLIREADAESRRHFEDAAAETGDTTQLVHQF